MSVEELVRCPHCHGAGSVTLISLHEHQWRLEMSMGGENFNLQTYICEYPGCEAQICSDCRADGKETCRT